MAREQVEVGQRSRCWRRSARPRRVCAPSSASRSPRFRNTTCRCRSGDHLVARGAPFLRPARSTRIGWWRASARIPHLKRAIELDPNFALAQALLSGVYANAAPDRRSRREYSQRAFELRDRVSERERFFISWRYYHDATQDWDKALELARTWTATYPREVLRVQQPCGAAHKALRAVRSVDRGVSDVERASIRRSRCPSKTWRPRSIAVDRLDEATAADRDRRRPCGPICVSLRAGSRVRHRVHEGR